MRPKKYKKAPSNLPKLEHPRFTECVQTVILYFSKRFVSNSRWVWRGTGNIVTQNLLLNRLILSFYNRNLCCSFRNMIVYLFIIRQVQLVSNSVFNFYNNTWLSSFCKFALQSIKFASHKSIVSVITLANKFLRNQSFVSSLYNCLLQKYFSFLFFVFVIEITLISIITYIILLLRVCVPEKVKLLADLTLQSREISVSQTCKKRSKVF